MTNTPTLALLQAMTLPVDPVAEWVHLLPAGTITTMDGRGPYRVSDAAALIAQSLHQGAKLPIDENHAYRSWPRPAVRRRQRAAGSSSCRRERTGSGDASSGRRAARR